MRGYVMGCCQERLPTEVTSVSWERPHYRQRNPHMDSTVGIQSRSIVLFTSISPMPRTLPGSELIIKNRFVEWITKDMEVGVVSLGSYRSSHGWAQSVSRKRDREEEVTAGGLSDRYYQCFCLYFNVKWEPSLCLERPCGHGEETD